MNVKDLLQNVPLFYNLSPGSLDMITPLFEEENHSDGTRIIQEGDPGESMFVIVSGRVSITKYAGEGNEVLITKLMEGSYFGEIALINSQPRTANVIADGETTLLRLRKSVFDELLAENSDFAVHFYRNCLSESMTRMRETATNLTVSQNVLLQTSNRLDKIDADLSDAKTVQDYFLSVAELEKEGSIGSGIRHSYIYRPYLDVGGDFLNLTCLGAGRYGILIADVMGHGISAALATGVIRSAYTIFSKQSADDPSGLMGKLNDHLYEIFPSRFATAYYALIDSEQGVVRLCKAGHMHPLVWKAADGSLHAINLPGLGLGIKPNLKFVEGSIDFTPGDRMLFFTDGITEQKNPEREMYGIERLESAFTALCRSGSGQIVQDIFRDIEQFKGKVEFQDDITLFLLEF